MSLSLKAFFSHSFVAAGLQSVRAGSEITLNRELRNDVITGCIAFREEGMTSTATACIKACKTTKQNCLLLKAYYGGLCLC